MWSSILGMTWCQGPLQDPSATASISTTGEAPPAPDESPWTRLTRQNSLKLFLWARQDLKSMALGNMERWVLKWATAGGLELESPIPPHPKGALLDWDLVTVEAIWVKWTHCHVQETSLRWFELCDMVHYPAGSNIRRCVHCSHKGMDMVSNSTQVGCGI